MKNQYIIIRGPLGIGKSTIAKKLAKSLKAEYISIDFLLEKFGLDQIKGGCIPLENFLKVNEKVFSKLKGKLNKGKSIIIDGNFYHKKQIEDLIKRLDYKHHIFTLKAPISVCIERDKNRRNAYGEEAVKEVHNLVSKVDYGTEIDTEGKSSEETIKEVLKRLRKK